MQSMPKELTETTHGLIIRGSCLLASHHAFRTARLYAAVLRIRKSMAAAVMPCHSVMLYTLLLLVSFKEFESTRRSPKPGPTF